MTNCFLAGLIVAVCIFIQNIASASSSGARNQGEAANLDDLLKEINSRGTNSTTKPVAAIVGGVPSENGEYPWFGRIDIRFSNGAGLTCGATLIHTDFAISAAHCLINYLSQNPDLNWTVKFNLGAIQYDGSDGTVVEVEKALYPSDYDTTLATNDIILYKLRTATDVEPLAWNANPLLPAVYAPVTIVGFGLTTDQGDASSILLKADVEIISNQQCKSFYGSYVLYNVVCALSPGKGSCQGDSGGPIFTANGFTENLMYGVGSYGGKCGEKPVGFTRTSSFRKFIQTSICSYSAFPPDSCNIPVPSSTPVTSSTSAPATIQLIAASPPTGDGIGTDDADTPCGLFSLSIFCPLTFGGVLGRLLKAIFGF